MSFVNGQLKDIEKIDKSVFKKLSSFLCLIQTVKCVFCLPTKSLIPTSSGCEDVMRMNSSIRTTHKPPVP